MRFQRHGRISTTTCETIIWQRVDEGWALNTAADEEGSGVWTGWRAELMNAGGRQGNQEPRGVFHKT